MHPDAQRLREALLSRDPSQNPAEAVTRLFREKPAEEAAHAIWEATHDLDYDTLGNLVFPFLRAKLRTDEAIFRAMTTLLANREIASGFRIVLMNFLDHAVRNREDRRFYFMALRDVAASASQPTDVRMHAMRSLAVDTSEDTRKVLGALLKSGKQPLRNAAAYVLGQWKDRGQTVSRELVSLLTRYAQASSKQALRSPGVIGALARLSPPSLRRLASRARTAEEQANLLGAAGNRMDVHTLATLIRTVMKKPDPRVKSALQGALAVTPSLLPSLHDGRYRREYLYAYSLAPYRAGKPELTCLEKLSRCKEKELAVCARSVIQMLPTAQRPRAFRKAAKARTP